jgi:CubicO group peptidase (beta-lactamase class C family)
MRLLLGGQEETRNLHATCTLAAVLSLVACGGELNRKDIESARIDGLMSDLHQRGLFDGAVVVGDDRSILYERGFGDANAERHLAFTPDTPADGASLAKTFTAALLLMLQSEGRLKLDDPVQRYVPELPYVEITLRHLLSHSSGLPVADYDYFDPFLPKTEVRTTARLVTVLHDQRPPLSFAPGTAFEYSSFGYDVAALAAGRAAASTFSALLRERIFGSLSITSAFIRPGLFADFPGVRTLGYRLVNGKAEVNDVFEGEGFHGGSNVYISARDLHRWNMSFLTSPVLEPAALGAALEFARIGDAESGLTLGNWYHEADGSTFWYSGHLQGFHSEVFRDLRTRRSIVYVSNNTIQSWLQKALVRAVDAILDGADPPAMNPPATDDVSKDELASLAGTWTVEGGTVRIERTSDRLSMMHNGVGYRMVQVESRMFYVPGLDYMVGFAKTPSGPFAKMYIASNVSERWAAR